MVSMGEYKAKQNCYPDRVPPRACLVTLTDSRGIRHTVEVTAESLFEAGVLAVSAFRKAGWVEEAAGLASRLGIEVREPVVRHTVALAQLERWANGATGESFVLSAKIHANTTSELENARLLIRHESGLDRAPHRAPRGLVESVASGA